jgi:beta-lactamase class A
MSLLLGKLETRLNMLATESEAILGFGVKDLTSGEQLLINGDEIFPVASTIKVAILIEFFKQVEAGKLDPLSLVIYRDDHKTMGSGVFKTLTPDKVTTPLIDHARLMITVSDNTSTNLIIDLLGREAVNETLLGLGLIKTRLTRKIMDMESLRAGLDNITTPREMLHLFEMLHSVNGISPFVSKESLNILKKPKEGLIQGVIRTSVPDKFEVADKSGWVENATLDVGVVYLPNRPYIIGVYSKHVPETDLHMFQTLNDMTRATRLIHAYFTEISNSTPYGRRRM